MRIRHDALETRESDEVALVVRSDKNGVLEADAEEAAGKDPLFVAGGDGHLSEAGGGEEPAGRGGWRGHLAEAAGFLAKWWKTAALVYGGLHLCVAALMNFDRARTPFMFVLFLLAVWAARRAAEIWGPSLSGRVSEVWREKGRKGLMVAAAFALGVGLVVNIATGLHRVIPLLGLCAAVLIGYALSYDRAGIRWWPVAIGFFLQYFFALLILQTRTGLSVFQSLGDSSQAFLNYSNAGGDFVFSKDLADSVVVALRVLPSIIFFSAVSSVLVHTGVLGVVVSIFGSVMQHTMQATAVESLCAAANVFLGQSEAPLLIAPFIEGATNAELHAIMTAGFSTIAGGVMAAYLAMGVPASHLLGASVISAPAALAMSKIVVPIKEERHARAHVARHGDAEGNQTPTDHGGGVGSAPEIPTAVLREHSNLLEAATSGASRGLQLAANVGGMLIAFISIEAFLDDAFSWWWGLVGHSEIDFSTTLAVVFFPFSFLMGTPVKDCWAVGKLLGLKTVLNEFVAYTELKRMQENGELEERSVILSTYALCGFSNFASVGVQLASLSILAPSRTHDLSRLVLSALMCGFMACFTTACVAGLLL